MQQGWLVNTKRRLFVLLPIAVIAVAAYWFVSAVHASYGYSVESEFTLLPANDVRFQQCLKAQPGVVEHTVRVERAGTKDTTLKVHFIQSRNLLGKPDFPALDRACRDFGYGAPVSEFRDCLPSATL
jgi:hypothetical protein